MTEPPRPAGDSGADPTAPINPPSYTMPADAPETSYGSSPPGLDKPAGQPAPPAAPAAPTSGGAYSMPAGGGDYPGGPTGGASYTPPPTSGAGGYPAQPSSGAGYPGQPSSGAGYPGQPGSGAGYQPSSGAGYQPTSGAAGYPPPQYPSQQPGYGVPPGGYGAQQVGYPAAGYGAGPAGYANPDEKTYAMIAHWGGVAGLFVGAGLLGWVGPLIAYVSKGKESATINAHALTSLNFHLTWAGANLLAWIITAVTCGVGSPLVFIAWIIPVVLGIIGSVKAMNGEFYRYPASINIIK